MRLPTWLSDPSDHRPAPSRNLQISDTSSSSNGSSSVSDTSSSSNASSSVSLPTNISLQTLPSVPSLQNLSPATLNLSVSFSSTSFLLNLPITSLAIQAAANLLYVASAHQIYVYDRTAFSHVDTINNTDSSSGYIKSLSICGGKLFTAHQDCKIRVWKMTPAKQHKLSSVLPTADDRLRRFMLPRNYVTVRRHKKLLWIEHADAVTGLAVNDGLVYSVSWDKHLKIWRASNLRCLESVKAHDDAVNAVVVSTNGTVYTGSADCRIRVWAKPVKEKRHVLMTTLEKHKSAVNALALNDDGSVLFSGACDRSILVWEREDSANHMVVSGALRGHKKAILSLIYVSGLLISGAADCTVRIWQRGLNGSYCCLAVLEGHRKPVKSLAVALEDEFNGVVSLYSGSLDGEVRAWEITVSRPQVKNE